MKTMDEIVAEYKDAVLWSNEDKQIECFAALAKRVQALEAKELPGK